MVRDTRGDFDLSLGRPAVAAGSSTNIPVHLKSGLDLVEVTFELEAPAARGADGLGLAPLAGNLGSAELVPSGADRYAVRLTSGNGQVLQLDADIAHLLDLTAVAGQESAVVPLLIHDLAGRRSGGQAAVSPHAGNGRIAVVGNSPLLDIAEAGALVLHGLPGDTIQIDVLSELGGAATWTHLHEVTLEGSSLTLDRNQLPGGTVFLRAQRK